MFDLLIQNVTVVDPQGARRTRSKRWERDCGIRCCQHIAAISPAGQAAPSSSTRKLSPRRRRRDGRALPGLIKRPRPRRDDALSGRGRGCAGRGVVQRLYLGDGDQPDPRRYLLGRSAGGGRVDRKRRDHDRRPLLRHGPDRRSFAASGLRGELAWTLFGQDASAELGQAGAFAARWHGAADGRIRTWLGPHAPYTCSPAFLREVAAEARRLGLGCHIHVSETAEQVQASLAQHGVTPVRLLEQLGLLDGPLLCAHAIHATSEDIALLAERGASGRTAPRPT